jgi:hypothetical protein
MKSKSDLVPCAVLDAIGSPAVRFNWEPSLGSCKSNIDCGDACGCKNCRNNPRYHRARAAAAAPHMLHARAASQSAGVNNHTLQDGLVGAY